MRRGTLALWVVLWAAAAHTGEAPLAGAADASTVPAVATDLDAVTRVVGSPRGRAPAATALEAETLRVAGLLRCPVCQGLSVADSPAETAVNMRNQVRELVAAGFSQEQILAYFERSYGEFVRLEPPLRGVNWSLWLAPLAGLLVGGAFVWWILRGPGGAPRGEKPTEGQVALVSPGSASVDALPDDPKLAEYLRRVRELAYEWPDGVRPEGTEKP